MSMVAPKLKAPFPAFGGKSRVAGMVWPRLSTEARPARNYIEPFCFSAAMLLLRPDEPQIETINDLNVYVANFWRAVQADPVAVAEHADWPVNEADLHARHAWLVRSHDAAEKLQRVRDEPGYFDAKIAGWWCWGACMWIGSGWCDTDRSELGQQIPLIGENAAGRGVNAPTWNADAKRPQLCNGNTQYGQWVHRKPEDLSEKLPVIGDRSAYGRLALSGQKMRDLDQKRTRLASYDAPGLGVHAELKEGRPQLADAYSRGRGVHGNDELTDCEKRRLWLIDWMTRLSDRLRPVRVCCGHWQRVCDSDSTLTRLGTTAVFLDPPYRKKLADGTVNRAEHIYANDKSQDVDAMCDEVQAWCLKWGGDQNIRIALCGLEGEYPDLDAAGWEKVAWKSQGGYGNRNKENDNAARERIWFSPHCLTPEAYVDPQKSLFAD